MNYLVTGATGFIGRFLVESLAERGTVHVLVREQSADKFEGLKERLGDLGKQLKPVWGDIAEPAVIGNAKARAALVGKIDHVFHLAAIYDMNMVKFVTCGLKTCSNIYWNEMSFCVLLWMNLIGCIGYIYIYILA